MLRNQVNISFMIDGRILTTLFQPAEIADDSVFRFPRILCQSKNSVSFPLYDVSFVGRSDVTLLPLVALNDSYRRVQCSNEGCSRAFDEHENERGILCIRRLPSRTSSNGFNQS